MTPEQKKALQQAAIAIAEEQLSANPTTRTPDGRPVAPGTTEAQAAAVPPGMVYDPNTGGYYDAANAARRNSGYMTGLIGNVTAGMIGGGEYADEAFGAAASAVSGGKFTPEMATEYARQVQGQFAEDKPGTALAARIGGGVVSSLGAAKMVGKLAPKFTAWLGGIMPTSATPRAVALAASGGVAGGIEGAVSGYGAGTTPNDRKAKAQEYGVFGTAAGVVAGPVGAVAERVGSKIFRGTIARLEKVKQRIDGMSPAATRLVRDAVSADAAGGNVRASIRRAGGQAMPADAGPATADLLDSAVAMSNSGAAIAGGRVTDRVSQSGRTLAQTFDATMGGANSVRQLGELIDDATKPGIKAAYRSAYTTPIDYSTPAGRKIEAIYSKIPNRIKERAITLAREMMDVDNVPEQWLIKISENGKAIPTRIPGVAELDYVKRALDSIVDDGTDAMTGKLSSEARIASIWAHQLRDAVSDAVPSYKDARGLASDAFSLHRAVALGEHLLKPGTKRDEVRRWVSGASDVERKAAISGLRADIDERLANVRVTLGNPDVDTAQVKQVLKDMRSPAARQKIFDLLGPRDARKVFRSIDEAASAVELSGNVARNSKTAPRQRREAQIAAAQDYSAEQLGRDVISGQPLTAMRKGAQIAAGNTPIDKFAQQEAMYLEIAEYLTGKRGGDALRAAEQMLVAAQTNPQIERRLSQWAANAGISAGLPAYQYGAQSTRTGPQ